MSKTVGIVGCGWLGLPLAEHLIGAGYTVKGTVTRPNKINLLAKKGIEPHQLVIGTHGMEGDFKAFVHQVSTLVVNIPPNLRRPPFESYVAKMKTLLTSLDQSQVKHLIFISSTSVYGSLEGMVTEESSPRPETESGKQLWQSEQLLKNQQRYQTTVIRLGGLIGPDRHPVTHLSGKTGLPNGDAAVNLIHQKDAIRIITRVWEDHLWGLTINGVYPSHPTKRDYYKHEALKRGLTLPEYLATKGVKTNKIVQSCLPDSFFSHPITTN